MSYMSFHDLHRIVFPDDNVVRCQHKILYVNLKNAFYEKHSYLSHNTLVSLNKFDPIADIAVQLEPAV